MISLHCPLPSHCALATLGASAAEKTMSPCGVCFLPATFLTSTNLRTILRESIPNPNPNPPQSVTQSATPGPEEGEGSNTDLMLCICDPHCCPLVSPNRIFQIPRSRLGCHACGSIWRGNVLILKTLHLWYVYLCTLFNTRRRVAD